jgi:hypothetical protein
MNERATAPKPPEGAQLSGAEPTLAAGAAAPADAVATTPTEAGATAEDTPSEPTPGARAESAPTQSSVGATSAKAHDARAPDSELVNDWTGKEVAGRYRILERIGEGGMGVVYVAQHLSLQKKVAFKVIHPQLAKHDELLLRFQREALATGQLDHPHITAAIDFGELEGGGAFMVMPWVRGRTLQAELDDKGRMEYRRAAEICGQIADALSATSSPTTCCSRRAMTAVRRPRCSTSAWRAWPGAPKG